MERPEHQPPRCSLQSDLPDPPTGCTVELSKLQLEDQKMTDFSELVGKTLTSVTNRDGEEIIFVTDADEKYTMYHPQDCCESVSVEDINGDLADLIGAPILVAEEAAARDPSASESGTWTFYKLATNKGWVDIRWYGSSNGYYSESFSFSKY